MKIHLLELSAWFVNRNGIISNFSYFFQNFQDFLIIFESGSSVGKLFRYQIGCCRFENMKVHILRTRLEHMQSKRSYIKYFLFLKNNVAFLLIYFGTWCVQFTAFHNSKPSGKPSTWLPLGGLLE